MPDIRLSIQQDYSAISAVLRRVTPENMRSEDQLRRADATRPDFCKHQRWIAEQHGVVQGFAYYTQFADLYDPHLFWVKVVVLPEHQRRGIGSALYAAVSEGVAAHNPKVLKVGIREDRVAGLAFAVRHGFIEYSRRIPAELDVQSCDLSHYADSEAVLATQGITLRSAAALAEDPDRDRKLYDLQWALDQDVPISEPITRLTMDQFRAQVLDNPRLSQEGTFVATRGGDYIGLSTLYEQDAQTLGVDITGTIGPYRRLGVATALKVRAIRWAQQQGYRTIEVTNDAVNAGMLAINRVLGFKSLPAEIQMQKHMVGS